MAKYLVEVKHGAKTEDCARAVHFFLTTGSHFMTHAQWGCLDGVHKGWIIVEAENKEAARDMVPPGFREEAVIVGLNKFTVQEMDAILNEHKD